MSNTFTHKEMLHIVKHAENVEQYHAFDDRGRLHQIGFTFTFNELKCEFTIYSLLNIISNARKHFEIDFIFHLRFDGFILWTRHSKDIDQNKKLEETVDEILTTLTKKTHSPAPQHTIH